MRTDFFCKKVQVLRIFSLFVLILMALLLYSRIKKAPALNYSASFYFIVSEELNIEASTELIKFGGGAGYLIQKGAREYVALNVYLDKIEAENVCERLTSAGNKVEILVFEKSITSMAGMAKNTQKYYAGGLSSLKSCISVLSQTINLLDKGLSQERACAILQDLARQLSYLANEYTQYEKFSLACNNFSRRIRLECQEVLYAAKLRFILCDCAVGYLQLLEK